MPVFRGLLLSLAKSKIKRALIIYLPLAQNSFCAIRNTFYTILIKK